MAWVIHGSTKPKSAQRPRRLSSSHPKILLPVARPCTKLDQRPIWERESSLNATSSTERSSLLTPLVFAYDKIRPSVTHPEFESLLEAAIARVPPESQAGYRALQNAHTSDKCPLVGIVKIDYYAAENLFDGSDMSARYAKLHLAFDHRCLSVAPLFLARHPLSCISNVKSYFKDNSFSIQFYALRDIEAGDQLFYLIISSLAHRQADPVRYSFVWLSQCHP
jgi:hypothetical protein